MSPVSFRWERESANVSPAMPERPDFMRVLEDTSKQLQEAMTTAAKDLGLPAPILKPLMLQAEFVEQAARRQQDFESQVEGLLRPLVSLVKAFEQAPDDMRKQADGLEAASSALAETAKALRLQADVLGGALKPLKGPWSSLTKQRAEPVGT